MRAGKHLVTQQTQHSRTREETYTHALGGKPPDRIAAIPLHARALGEQRESLRKLGRAGRLRREHLTLTPLHARAGRPYPQYHVDVQRRTPTRARGAARHPMNTTSPHGHPPARFGSA